MGTLRTLHEWISDKPPVVRGDDTKDYTTEELLADLVGLIERAMFVTLKPDRISYFTGSAAPHDEYTYTFTGTPGEMKLLYDALQHYLLLQWQRGTKMGTQIVAALKLIERAEGFYGGESLGLPRHRFNLDRAFGQLSDIQLFAACLVLAAGYELAASDLEALDVETIVRVVLEYRADSATPIEERLVEVLA